ncbi:MAG: glycosyltransferase family A protein [Candidatus Saccharibacteria bacterium]|nr:glycosyltransferase family A protein [Lachnospiraceae bacterium]MDO4986749.1 glycosyltransferase family A protein [Candidatus Saccharibacteria bacterium]
MPNLISIIIPLYNSERYISACIESCINQTYKNIEIIVVDDGSTDNGLTVVKQLAKTQKNLIIIHKDNGGVSSARNAGVEIAHGEYICFVDADDCLDKKFVETMLGYMLNNKSDFCFSKNTISKKMQKGRFSSSPKIISSAEAEALLLSQKVKVGCWNKMYKKAILPTPAFCEDLFYGEGLYFINQIAHKARNIIACEDELYNYRKVNPESATTKFNIKKMENGEKSLLAIKEFIVKDGRKVNHMWSMHYCLFCVNAMRGILRTDKKDYSYKKWHHKLTRNILPALLSTETIKSKLRIIAAFISPKLLNKLTERKR